MADEKPLQLRTGDQISFRVDGNELVFTDYSANTFRNYCVSLSGNNFHPTVRKVSLYNVLWAEVGEHHVTVDVAYPRGNQVQLKTWKVQLSNLPPTTDAQDTLQPDHFVQELLKLAYRGEPRPRRAYVLINPKSGPRQAQKRWETEVKPLFEAARLSFDAVLLERGGQATDLCEAMDLNDYDTIVALSGDGTPHEIFNGLAKRPDAGKALQSMAVGHIPCGSGNALCYNLYGTSTASGAALGVIKGTVVPLDLMSVTQGDQRHVAFLSQTLGIIAESDLGTEDLRWMGSTRFDVGITIRALKHRCYPFDIACKVEYKGHDEVKARYREYAQEKDEVHHPVYPDQGMPPLQHGTINDAIPEGWVQSRHDDIGCFYVGNMGWITKDDRFFCGALPSDGCMEMIMTPGDKGFVQTVSLLTDVGRNKNFDLNRAAYQKVSAYRVTPRDQEDGFFSVDGESKPFVPFQVEVHQGLARVIARSNLFMMNGPTGWDDGLEQNLQV